MGDVDSLNRAVGLRVRRRRRELGLTQAQLGKICGVTYQQAQKYEGGASISAARLWAIAVALDVSIDYFFEDLATRKFNAEDPEMGAITSAVPAGPSQ